MLHFRNEHNSCIIYPLWHSPFLKKHLIALIMSFFNKPSSVEKSCRETIRSQGFQRTYLKKKVLPNSSSVRGLQRSTFISFEMQGSNRLVISRDFTCKLFYGGLYHPIPLLEKDQYERIRRLRLIVYHHNLHRGIGRYT
jgi:hypothetical protein